MKTGLEFHQRLATEHKLFCKCSAELAGDKPLQEIRRKLRPVVGELGEIDPAAFEEYLKKKTFVYQVFRHQTCLVELDEAPPEPLNQQALDIAIEIALLLNCTIVDEIHVMRKTVIDGSNTTGFQRTMLVGHGGSVGTKHGAVEITGVYLEEEAAGIVGKKGDEKTYRLDRLGIPLVEISTGILELTPEQVKEVALEIGRLLRITGKVQRGIGSIRQDVNISVPNGARVEIKGVQDIRILDRIIIHEASRQERLIKEGKKVSEETRRANEDGTTEYMRVLPGSDRMYPETDIPVILIDPERIARIRDTLPEKPQDILERLQKKYSLGEQLARKIVLSENRSLFEGICEKTGADWYMELFMALAEKKISREAIPSVLESWAKHPGERLADILKKEKLGAASGNEIEKFVKGLALKHKGDDRRRAFNIIMGEVMKKYRGRAGGDLIAAIVDKELKQ